MKKYLLAKASTKFNNPVLQVDIQTKKLKNKLFFRRGFLCFFTYTKKSLKQLRDKNATKEEIKVNRYIFKHVNILNYITTLLCINILSVLFSLYLCGIGLTCCFISLTTKLYFFTIIGLFIIVLLVMIQIISIKRDRWIKKGKRVEEFKLKLLDEFLNIYLINPLVVSYKDWKKIKKVSQKNYDKIRSVKGLQRCYETTFYIANILKNKKVKIMWLCCDSGKIKFGHAVLAKGRYILDTNRKKCYNKKKYLKTYNAKVYKEFTLDEYLIKNPKGFDLLVKEGLHARGVYIVLKKYWDEFKGFCEENGAIRCNNDESVTDESQE